MTTKPNEPKGLEPCPFCGEADYLTAPESHAAGMTWWQVECGCGAFAPTGNTKAEAIAAWNRRAPAQPVAGAGGVDVELFRQWMTSVPCNPNTWEQELAAKIESHRLQSVAAATAAKDAEIAELAEAVRCIMARCEALEDEAFNGIATTTANGRDETHDAGFWRGQKSTAKSIREHLHDMTRAALSEAREAGE